MTARTAIVVFLIGVELSILGNLFKIQHWPFASLLLMGSALLQSIAVIVLLVKVWGYPGLKDFLDR